MAVVCGQAPSCRPFFKEVGQKGKHLTPLLWFGFLWLPQFLPPCGGWGAERQAGLLPCGPAHVVTMATAHPRRRQSLRLMEKAIPCCLLRRCCCGRGDNEMPLLQTGSLTTSLGSHWVLALHNPPSM